MATATVAALKKSKHGIYGKRLATTVVTVEAGDRWESRAHAAAAAQFAAELPGLRLTTEVLKVQFSE